MSASGRTHSKVLKLPFLYTQGITASSEWRSQTFSDGRVRGPLTATYSVIFVAISIRAKQNKADIRSAMTC
jgi:hypothetical protein